MARDHADAKGTLQVDPKVEASERHGTIDRVLKFPDGAVARACSQLVPLTAQETVYSFLLLPPPMPLEQLEGALEEQSLTLEQELAVLKKTLERE